MKVLQTVCRGYSVDPQRLHDSRPEIVYEVVGEIEPAPPPKPRMALGWRIYGMACTLWMIYVAASILNGAWLFR